MEKDTQSDSENFKEPIIKLLKEYIQEDQLDDYLFNYLYEMIIEDNPDNETDLSNLLSDYLTNQLSTLPTKINSICVEVLKKLRDIGFKKERRAIIAERLDETIQLSSIKVGSENTITSLCFDPNATIARKDVVWISSAGSIKIKIEQKIQQSEALMKHLDDIRKMKETMETITMHHDRDDSYKVNIISNSFNISIGGKTLFEDATLKVTFGKRYVLVGRNGIGKTTLLNHIARKEIDGVPKHLQILHVEQEIIANENTLMEEVLSCDVERIKLLNDQVEVNAKLNSGTITSQEESELAKHLMEISERLRDIGADEAEVEAAEILRGLGFSNTDFEKRTKHFSGGWRMRIALAKALYVKPDLLLLDEPTNHLDMNAVMWLEDYLCKWPYTLIVVSHARNFINNIATDIMNINTMKLEYWKGNYEDFEKARSDKMKMLQRQKASQVKKVEHIQGFIDKFRYNAKRASLVQSRIKSLSKMEDIEEIMEDPTCIFVFPASEALNPPILRLDNVDLGYNDVNVLSKISISIDMSSRVAFVGPNGAGKSTLLKALIGTLNPSKGLIFRHSKLKIALFTQHHIDQLNLDISPVEQIALLSPNMGSEPIRAHLSSFGITGALALRPIYLLSGGQKTRVALAALILFNPQIILMDEPTNHLDIDAVKALSVALNAFNGGLIVVSHDQHFVESVCSQIYIIKDKKCSLFKGNFNDYKKLVKKGS